MNTKSVGERTEAIVLAELLKYGYVVLLPFGDNQRYDLVVDKGIGFKKVQCKTARSVQGGAALSFKAYSSYAHRGNPQKGYKGEADLFGVYSPTTKQVYLIPVDEVGETEIILRLAPAKNGQTAGIKYANSYLIQ